MIDRLIITIKKCSISTTHIESKEQDNKNYFPIYYSDDIDNPAYLTVSYNPKSKVVKIDGSIRKWYLGVFSLDDLTAEQFQNSMERIAEILQISMEKLMSGTITQCEIGLNVKTRIPAEKVNQTVRAYKKYKYYRYEFETVGFLSDSLTIKLYDKCQELLTKFKKYDKNKEAEKRFKELKEQGIYTLRVEFTLKDERSFTGAKLGHLHTVGGLINGYYDTIPYFVNQCSKLEVGVGINFDDERITKRDYAILVGVYYLGFFEFSEEYAKRSLVNLNGKGVKKGGAERSAICDARNEVKALIEKYKDPKKYHVHKFRVDIYQTLKSQYLDFVQESKRVLIRGLWEFDK